MQRRFPWIVFMILQLAVIGVFGAAYAMSSARAKGIVKAEITGTPAVAEIPVPRSQPLVIEPMYDRPDLVSDEELAAVLDRVVPRFDPHRTKPNWVEHALRIWGIGMEFDDPSAMSGQQLKEFLTDHATYTASWGDDVDPLLVNRPGGVAIRWGLDEGASVHHDHWLASLTEAGVSLDEPVFGPGRHGATVYDVLQESLRDFRLDERETEWTAMAFGLWLPPTRSWTGSAGRQYSFDLLARRLLRGHKNKGVCSGTHRVYSLVVLLRLDDNFDILSDRVSADVLAHLEEIRNLLIDAQCEDGRWPSNWAEGETAAADPIGEDVAKAVIATGHHLEWLAIAPREFHPPDEVILRAARWAINETTRHTAADIMPRYTFYSHVAGALALWRNTSPAEFYSQWQDEHPIERKPQNTVDILRRTESED